MISVGVVVIVKKESPSIKTAKDAHGRANEAEYKKLLASRSKQARAVRDGSK